MGRRATGNGVSAWRLIVEELRREIADDVWPMQSKLPPEAELAERFGVHRNTVRHALAALAADGLVTSRRGSGTYVTGRPILRYRIRTRTRLTTGLQVNGRPPGGRLLSHEVVAAPPADVTEDLRLEGRAALLMEAVRTVNGETIARSTHWFDAATTDGLVADREAPGDRVLAPQDVHVGAAEGGGGHAHQRVERTDVRDRLLVEHDASRLDEDGGFHHGHGVGPCSFDALVGHSSRPDDSAP